MRESKRVAWPLLGCILVATVFSTATALAQMTTVEVDNAYFTAHEADAPIRNFVYLSLRLAGIAWVIVEWIAAIYLVRGYRLLRRHIENRSPQR